MKWLGFLLALLAGPAFASCPAYPFALTNGTTADANQVMANFNAIQTCVNALPTVAVPITIVNGGTGATTAGGAATNLHVLQIGNNLNDVSSVSSARTNLGVTATGADTTYAFRANNLSDIASPSTALSNLGALAKASNLADVASVSTARTNLGLGGAAVLSVGTTVGTVAAGNDSRFAGPTQNAPSCPYGIVATDAGKELFVNSGSCTVTIPSNGSVPFAIGTKIEGVNDCAAGTMTLSITSDTLEWFPTGGTGTRTIAACSIWQITKINTTEWALTGVGIT